VEAAATARGTATVAVTTAPPAAPAPVPAPAPAPAPAPSATTKAGPAATTNRPPTAVGKNTIVKANTPTAIGLKGTDPEGAKLVYSVVDFPENGRLTGRAPNLSYTPDKGFVGTDAFTFTVNDGVSTSEEAVVAITVTSPKKTVARKTTKKK
jgi:Bacterial Ig domain